MDEDDSGTVEGYGFLLSDVIEGGIFVYVPRPEDLQNCLAPGSFSCVLFTIEWERGRVQAANRMSEKQRHKATYMECPFLVR